MLVYFHIPFPRTATSNNDQCSWLSKMHTSESSVHFPPNVLTGLKVALHLEGRVRFTMVLSNPKADAEFEPRLEFETRLETGFWRIEMRLKFIKFGLWSINDRELLFFYEIAVHTEKWRVHSVPSILQGSLRDSIFRKKYFHHPWSGQDIVVNRICHSKLVYKRETNSFFLLFLIQIFVIRINYSLQINIFFYFCLSFNWISHQKFVVLV